MDRDARLAGEPVGAAERLRARCRGRPDPFVSIEATDVDAIQERALTLGHEIVYALRDEEWGVRRFMVGDQAGRVVNVLSHHSD